MRPSFAHIDALFEGDDFDTSKPDPGDEAKPVLFRKPESERAALLKRTSYAAKKEREEAEEWIPLDVHAYGAENKSVRKQCACPPRDRMTDLKFVTREQGGTQAYVKSLNYLEGSTKRLDDGTMEDFNPATVPHDVDQEESQARVEPNWKRELAARVASLFQGRSGVSVPYPVIRSRFRPSIADKDLLEAISASAVLLRGNFVLKSSLMGFSNASITEARDVILILFKQHGFLERAKLSAMFSKIHDDPNVISDDILNGILRLLGKKVRNGMEMKIEDDLTFGAEFPDVAKKHEEYWDQKMHQLNSYIVEYDAQLDPI